jgi:hypothetical protein
MDATATIITPRKKKVKKRNVEDMMEDKDCGEIEPKPKKKKYKTVIEFDSAEANQELSVSVDKKQQNEEILITKPKSRKSFTITMGEDDNVKKAKKSRATKSLSPNSTIDFKTSSLAKALTDMKIQRNALKKNSSPTKVTPLMGKKNSRKSFGGLTTPNSEAARRRINFVLAKNLEHGTFLIA